MKICFPTKNVFLNFRCLQTPYDFILKIAYHKFGNYLHHSKQRLYQHQLNIVTDVSPIFLVCLQDIHLYI